MCVLCVLSSCDIIASWSEFKSWLSEKKQKPESALSQVQQQKSQHIQQVVDGASHLLAEAVRWNEAGSELRERAVHVFQLQVKFGTRFCVCAVFARPLDVVAISA